MWGHTRQAAVCGGLHLKIELNCLYNLQQLRISLFFFSPCSRQIESELRRYEKKKLELVSLVLYMVLLRLYWLDPVPPRALHSMAARSWLAGRLTGKSWICAAWSDFTAIVVAAYIDDSDRPK